MLPLPTVFDGNGEVDEPVMRDLTQFYLERRINGFFLCGSFGQGPAMRIDQRKRVAALVAEEIRGRVPLVVQVGAADPYTGIELGLHARSIGATAISMVGPYYYNDRLPDEIVLHFQMVDEAVQLPLLVYDNPAYQGYEMTPKFMQRLARAIPRAFGASIASSETKGTIDEARPYMEALPEWAIFASACVLMPGMQRGIRGASSPPLTLAPELAVALVEAIDAGRTDEANWLQTMVSELAQTLARLMSRYGRAPCLEGLRDLGFPVKQYPRWPTVSIPEDERAFLLDLLRRVRAATSWMLQK
jgi:dihydrodipicolinate synthase/N-acetylneuraminate lyase